MEKARGRFITLEGIEGSGKSTQQALLCQWLREQGHEVVLTKEPGGTTIGRGIREILLHVDHDHMVPACEALLYLADRAQHHGEVVAPALERGAWVVCDRYHDSTLAYQGAARGLSAASLDQVFAIATRGLKPHLTLLLDMSPELGLARARTRNHEEDLAIREGRFEQEALRFHQAVREAFLGLAAAEPERFAVVNAERSPTEVAAELRQVVAARMASYV
jgi:dTMP kinase